MRFCTLVHAPLCQHDQCNLHHYAHECFWNRPDRIASPNPRRKWKLKILQYEIGMDPEEARNHVPEELAELTTAMSALRTELRALSGNQRSGAATSGSRRR